MNLKFHKEFVFRSPIHSFSKVIDSLQQITEIVKHKDFQEAIYLASPVLHDEMQRWLNGELAEEKEIEKLIYSLNKYSSRMQSRCTPYGLFASCSTGNWRETNEIVLKNITDRRTRLDMNFVCTLAQRLSKHELIQSYLLFYPNNSIYEIGEQLRYVEYKYVKNKRNHSITSVDASVYLKKILDAASKGATVSSLVSLLASNEITKQEAEEFIKEIIDSQILISELEPAVTGRDFIHQLLLVLERIDTNNPNEFITETIQFFNKIQNTFTEMDSQIGNEVKVYKELLNEFNALGVPVEEKYLFQVDAFRKTRKAAVDKSIQSTILAAIEFLEKINSGSVNNDLNTFKNRFFETYEQAEVPLLDVMDTESGIGYPKGDISGVNELVDDLGIQPKEDGGMSFNLNKKEELLFSKLLKAYKRDEYSVRFDDVDLKNIKTEKGILTPTIPLMFKVIDAKTNKIQIEYAGGGSGAATLLGRFAYGDEKILKIIKDIVSYEEEVISEKIIAEIVHLPESRTGNVLLRPVLRKYEISYLAKSGAEKENQILAEDLMVSVKNKRIVLRSKRLNKEVLPRLSTAHNYSFNSLPVYKFLCDLQMQDITKSSLMFSWGVLSKTFKFLPRAEYNDVIVFPATWNFSKEDYEELKKNVASEDFMESVKSWKEKWKMPRYIALKDGDNELLIDLESELSVKTFLDTVKNRSVIELTEFIFNPDTALVKDENGNPYTHEIIAILFNEDYKKKSENGVENKLRTANNSIGDVKRSFIPGSEWLYYKIYCGVKTADKLLSSEIKTMVEDLTNQKLIKKWFFIRYADQQPHIRLRFYNSDTNKINEIIKIIYQYLSPLQQKGIISKVVTDTYQRELERYGHNTIEIAEHYFMIDSWCTLNFLSIAVKDEELRWQFAAKSTDEFLDCFKYSLEEKKNLMEILKTSFRAEHSSHKSLKLQLDDKFRKLRKQLGETFSADNETLKHFSQLLTWKKQQVSVMAVKLVELKEKQELNVNINDLISNYLHMTFNRIFKGKQRTHEMVIYDMLYRYYKSEIAKEYFKKRLIRLEV